MDRKTDAFDMFASLTSAIRQRGGRSHAVVVVAFALACLGNPSNAQIPVADFNADGIVGFIDYNTFTSNGHKQDATFADGDLNRDGVVNHIDFFGFTGFPDGVNQYSTMGDNESARSPAGRELSLIVNSEGRTWLWGLLKDHPRERALLNGYSIRSKSGSLTLEPCDGMPFICSGETLQDSGRAEKFDIYLAVNKFEIASGDLTLSPPSKRIDGAILTRARVDPVIFEDLSFRYGTVEGVFESWIHPGIPGDADLDGEVQFSDFLAMSSGFNMPGEWASGDFDRNNFVDFADFLTLSMNFGEVLPGFRDVAPAAVPEPGCIMLSTLLSGLLLPTRRRRCREVSG